MPGLAAFGRAAADAAEAVALMPMHQPAGIGEQPAFLAGDAAGRRCADRRSARPGSAGGSSRWERSAAKSARSPTSPSKAISRASASSAPPSVRESKAAAGCRGLEDQILPRQTSSSRLSGSAIRWATQASSRRFSGHPVEGRGDVEVGFLHGAKLACPRPGRQSPPRRRKGGFLASIRPCTPGPQVRYWGREVGGGRASRQPGQVRKEAAVTSFRAGRCRPPTAPSPSGVPHAAVPHERMTPDHDRADDRSARRPRPIACSRANTGPRPSPT